MKHLAILLTLSGLSLPLHAGPNEADFAQLKDLREQALSAASQPINQMYRASLEQLLRRATQDDDTETAAKIKFELQALAEAPAAPPAMTPEASRLRVQLRGTEWRLSPSKTFTLHEDGSTSSSWHDRHGKWKVLGPNLVELTIANVSKGPAKVTVDPNATTMTWTMKDGDEGFPEVAQKITSTKAP